MSLIPEVKCPRCDRKYSGLRTRCPYCGARRSNTSTRTTTSDNSMWKMIVGLLLLVVLIVAVIVLIVTSVSDKGETDDENIDDDYVYSSNEGITSADSDIEVEPEPDPEPEPEPEPVIVTPAVQSVMITYNNSSLAYNSDLKQYEFTMKLGEELTLGARVTPDDTGLTPVWSVSDESVVVILQTGKVTAIGTGTAIITVTVGDVTAEALVRVKN